MIIKAVNRLQSEYTAQVERKPWNYIESLQKYLLPVFVQNITYKSLFTDVSQAMQEIKAILG